MPKLKSNRGAAKRFRATANGFKCRSPFRSHHFSSRSTKIKRHARAGLRIAEVDVNHIKQMLPFA